MITRLEGLGAIPRGAPAPDPGAHGTGEAHVDEDHRARAPGGAEGGAGAAHRHPGETANRRIRKHRGPLYAPHHMVHGENMLPHFSALDMVRPDPEGPWPPARHAQITRAAALRAIRCRRRFTARKLGDALVLEYA